jgi:serine/threonine protein kinase
MAIRHRPSNPDDSAPAELLDAAVVGRSIASVSRAERTCTSCQTLLPSDAAFCPRCGAASPSQISAGGTTTAAAPSDPTAEQQRRVQAALGPDYEVQRRIGSGGFAEVWAAFDRRLQRTVAVKVLHPDLVATHALLERFQREAQAVAKLRHPGVIPIYAVGEYEGLAYYIMPLVEGESLRDQLTREGPLPPDEVRRLLCEAAAALAGAHEAGIVHRDIKPENLMLEGKDRRLLVMDFGIAKSTAGTQTGLTGTGMIVGTPTYMSPEQATGSKEVDVRSDIYSLGVVGFELLTGKPPFTSQSVPELLLHHVSTPAPSVASGRPDIPEDVAIAVNRCLAKDPGERWKDAGELSAFLERVVTPASQPVKVSRNLRKFARRRWGPFATLRSSSLYASGLALLIIALGLFGRPAVRLVRFYWRTRPALRNAADAGIEIGRAALNDAPTLFPDSGYQTLQADQAVSDANGNPIPNFTRSIYLGPTRPSNGQGGTAASIISVIRDRSGPVVVRRGELARESFAEYGRFTASQGGGICFGGGDQVFGRMYTGGDMCIYNSGARFHDAVEVTGTITGINHATFDKGYILHGAAIPLPTAAAFSKLAAYASVGGMVFTTPPGGSSTQARVRIEFLALDLNGDGNVTGPDEGFFRVYVGAGSAQADYVTGTAPARENTSRNCGDFHTVKGVTTFYSAAFHLNSVNPIPGGSITHSAIHSIAATQSLQVTNSRCFLGGDDHLNVVGGKNTFVPADSLGSWMRYTTAPDPAVIAGLKNTVSNTVDTTLAARTLEAQYLWPLSRRFNPNSKGVIYVNGRLVVSGVLHGSVTVAASDNVVIADDLRYAIPPGSVPCLAADMLGLLSEDSIYVADNAINAAQPWGASGEYKTYKTNPGEVVQGVLLALSSFTVENYTTGPVVVQPGCRWGRGCLYETGGLISGTRGAVGTSSGTGYDKRYVYDACAAQAPPPHFPTTGRFFGSRNYFEIDPAGFDVAGFFRTHAAQ